MPENKFYSDFDRATIGSDEYRGQRQEEYRTPFQVDRDRIIHTSAFRRLQSKTQVFLSGEYDFYRTRLTHSIEVSQIGRGICDRLRHTSGLLGDDFFVDPDLVEAACLAHDLGHPPFGHTGERTLHRLMKPWGGFEGNGQTLRMLTETIFSGDKGMDPTRALMDGVLKYKSLISELDNPPNHFIYDEQGRYLDFVTDGAAFPPEFPPGKKRDACKSIECQIMDWADDTAYSLNDVADGIHAGFLTVEKIERWASDRNLEENKHLTGLLRAIREDRVESRMGSKIGRFIGATRLEKANERFLGERTHRHAFNLVIDEEIEQECSLYKRLSFELVFRSQQLQQLDRKADFVLTRLFEAFAEAYIHPKNPAKERKFQLLSDAQETRIFLAESKAERARLVCDAIAGMTDGFANRTYKRLFDADYGSISDLV
ncbi:MAG: dNTP triphosphohydrolase [Verrucomicrobiales bacterium]|nr:dNTP triphosphohydrolase [Verrucomicrobiales bacterium]